MVNSVTHTNAGREQNTLKIWQQNVNKSSTCQHDLISSARLAREGIDIVALQEPYIGNIFGNTVTARDWNIIFPTTHGLESSKTRSIILIRSNIITDHWSQIEVNSGDISAVMLKGNWGTIAIFNAYIDCAHDIALEEMARSTKVFEETQGEAHRQRAHTLWLGDFNRHHPHWDNPSDTRLFTNEAIKSAEKLISLVADAGLELALPPQMTTHKHNVTKKWTRLDQVFLSEHTMDSLVSCYANRREPGVNTDHLPILTTLNMAVTHTPAKTVANFRNVDWDKFREELRSQLASLGLPGPIRSQSSLDTECDKLTKALQDTISIYVPTSELGPKTKRWWTKELTHLRRKANKLGRQASKLRSNPKHHIHAEYEAAKKQYAREIDRNKKQHWRDWLEKAEDPDIWTAHKYISAAAADGNNTRIPTLCRQAGESEIPAATNEEKSRLLAETFFPQQNSNPTADEQEEDREVTPVCHLHKLTRDQITRHLAKLKPYKAPGPDGIPNIVLTKCADLLLDRLFYIYKAMIKRKLFYEPWKKFTTVVLRKPGKPKYNTPKAYRPIALINTQVKVLTAILAEQLMYYAEKHTLLPENHFGGRKGRNATDAVQLLTHKIKGAWRQRKVVSVLFLDIEGAFPNADNKKLLQNLTKRKIPRALISFIANMLKDRTTVLKFDGYISETITLNNGIGQGDPLSMALYQFYNADLLDIPEGNMEDAIAYVDDAILIASGKTFHDTHERLSSMMTRAGGAIEWAEKHNSRFEYNKLALIDFAHHSKKLDRPVLTLPNTAVKPTLSTKYLGIILDQNLKWNDQLAYVIGKGSKWAAQVRRVARPSWGLTPRSARKLYIGTALPKTLYGIEVWCNPPRRAGKGKASTTTAIRKLTTVQRAGALAITGGFRTTPTDTLDAHAALLPMHLRIGKICYDKAIRIAALPETHPLCKQMKTAYRRRIKRHKSAIHTLASRLKWDPAQIETIPVVYANPARRKSIPFKVSIPEDKEKSKIVDGAAHEEIKVYSDGSIHDGQVGAAAVLFRNGVYSGRTLRLHLGKADEHTIYEAELVGLLLAIQLIKQEKRGKTSCAIGADNQAAIQALQSELTKPGQHLAAEFIAMARKISKSRSGGGYNLTIRWTAGHVGIVGNERADSEAKAAARGDSSPRGNIPKYIRKTIRKSTSALKQDHNKKGNEEWKKEWNESRRFKRFRAPDIVTPSSKKFITLISDRRLTKRMMSLIFQLRVGHAPLNSYLHRFKKVDSAHCPACGEEQETAEHFMLRCPNYEHERWALLKHVKSSTPRLEDILSNPKTIIPVANYINATERFKTQEQEHEREQQQVQGKEVELVTQQNAPCSAGTLRPTRQT